MPVTVRRLLRHGAFDLRLANRGDTAESPIQWIYSSDLADPTPFLTGGEMLLTTGTQFPDDADPATFNAYVSRLVERGVVALGFGAEVFRSGTPAELVAACAGAGLPLVEVPYDTPFIAIIRWAAEIIARDARAHDEWAFASQRAISLAALGRGGLGAVLATLAERLACRVALFDVDLSLHPAVGATEFSDDEVDLLRSEARRLLRGARRSSGALEIDAQPATLQTLGQPGRLRGVIAILGGPEQDSATRAVITSAVALAEVALDEDDSGGDGGLALHTEALALVLAGHGESVARAVTALPTGRSRVVLVRVAEASADDRNTRLEDAISHRAGHAGGLFAARHRGALALVVAETDWPNVAAFLDSLGATAGVADVDSLADLGAGLARAGRALDAATRARADGRPGGITEFATLAGTTIAGMLPSSEASGIAAARLSAVLGTESGPELLRYAAVWLSHNGQWEPAAEELGLHRHSLKARLDRLGNALGLSLERFSDRAELWMMLTALDLGPGD
jgi:purine catabolism regulator